MKFTSVIGALFCVDAALAARFTQARRERRAKRPLVRNSQPRLPVKEGVDQELSVANDTFHDSSYSANWAGAVLNGSGYKSVTGTFVVPTPAIPSGGNSRTQYAASAWVGIDGDSCQSSILQAGLDFYVQGGEISYDAWYEWYPDYSYDFDGITLAAGNTIRLTITATTSTSGTAVIDNLSTGKTVSHTFTDQSIPLCESDADWIVEDFQSGDSLVPLANFGTIQFTGASASTGRGSIGLSDASILDIKQDDTVHTSCSAGSSTVTCRYI